MFYQFIFMLFVGSVSLADIRVVGNGGGLGEMKAVVVFQNMERYLTPCLKNAAACQLEAPEIAVVQKILQILPVERSRYNLEFYSSPTSEAFTTGHEIGSKLSINSSAVSDANGHPYSTNLIGTIIFRGLLQHLKIQTTNIPEKIFLNLQEQEQFVSLGASMIHWLKLTQLKQFVGDELLLEKTNKTYDLFSLLSNIELCNNPKNLFLRIVNLSQEIVSSESINVDIQWNCGGVNLGSAKVRITPKFSANEDLDVQHSSVQTYAIVSPRP